MSDPGLLRRFRRHYRGRWRAEDALAWLDDPTAPGPSGAPGPGIEPDRLRLDLYRRAPDESAAGRHGDAAERLAVELAVARAALEAARTGTDRRRAVRRGRMIAVLAGVIGAVALAAALLVPPVARPAATLALVAPATVGSPVWAARGIGSLPSSPVLEAPGSPVVVALACRGRGGVHVLVDQQDRRVTCSAARVRQDSEYFVGHHGRFTVALSSSAPVEWVLTVTAVGAG